jgi:hypothetical protein
MRCKKTIFILCIFIILSLTGCYSDTQNQENVPSRQSSKSILYIPLNGPITSKKAELSGLAWIGDTLVLLPQYPERFGTDEGALLSIPKQSILDYLDGKSREPITPNTIKFIAPGLKDSIQNYQGFEAVGFLNQNIYLTIESGNNNQMMGYLVSGTISSDQKEITLDTSHIVEIQPPIQMNNRAYEALVIAQNKILTFFEVNGASLNPQPAAHVFGLDLTSQGTISFPNLEYRVTDAALGSDGGIWIINKIAPKDAELIPKSDPLIEKYDGENTFANFQQVERLVKLNFSTSGITLADVPPIQIKLDTSPRNWEGLALLDNRGFLLVTDKSPDTLLGFIQMP